MTRKVLITGVNGLIGGEVYASLEAQTERFDVYGLDRSTLPSPNVSPDRKLHLNQERFLEVDLTDFGRVVSACQGMDVVIHMGANAESDAPWEDLLKSNIIGTYNVFEACRIAGVKRVVYASSVQTNFGYSLDEPYKAVIEGRLDDVPQLFVKVDHTMSTCALNPYGCTKIWGEALARTYVDSHGLSILCIRFGWVIANDALPYPTGRDVWCSCRDAVQMVTRCVMAPETLRFDVFYALSHSDYLWMDIDHAREVLGYVPQDHVVALIEK